MFLTRNLAWHHRDRPQYDLEIQKIKAVSDHYEKQDWLLKHKYTVAPMMFHSHLPNGLATPLAAIDHYIIERFSGRGAFLLIVLFIVLPFIKMNCTYGLKLKPFSGFRFLNSALIINHQHHPPKR